MTGDGPVGKVIARMPYSQGSPADLHMHSIYSDGTDDLPSLLKNVRERGVRIFSLTDHDTIEGALDMEKLIPEDMTFIRGIEFSTVCRLGKIHILGYGCSPDQSTFHNLVQKCADIRFEKMKTRMRKLKEKYGIELSAEEKEWLEKQKRPGKPHLAQILLKRGLVSSISEAMNTYLTGITGKSEIILPEEAIRAVSESGGVCVWAHPFWETPGHFYPRGQVDDQFARLAKAGLRGIECYYSLYGRDQTGYLTHLAAQRGMLISGGSDYHGTRKRQKIGELNHYGFRVEPEELTILPVLDKLRE